MFKNEGKVGVKFEDKVVVGLVMVVEVVGLVEVGVWRLVEVIEIVDVPDKSGFLGELAELAERGELGVDSEVGSEVDDLGLFLFPTS